MGYYIDRHNNDLVMLYLGGKLFSKLKHIKISAVCVYFNSLVAKKRNQKINLYKKSVVSGYL